MNTSYKKNLGDLYPNEQILDFRAGEVTALPDWLGHNLKLIMGAGDHEQVGDMPNIEYFSMFDVFLCLPENIGDSLVKNVKLLTTKYKNQKLLVFMDIADVSQITNFTNLFTERFILIDGHVGHTPHFRPKDYAKLLAEGGQALDIDERSHGITSASAYEKALNSDLLPNIRYNNKIRNGSKNGLSAESLARLIPKMKRTIAKYVDPDVLNPAILERIDTLPGVKQVLYLGIILQSSRLLNQLPISVNGRFEFVKREWKEGQRFELVLHKQTPEEFAAISKYRNALGVNNANIKRAEMLVDKIKNDIREGHNLWMQQTRRATLRKIINTKLKPRMTAGTRRRRRSIRK